MIRVCIELHPGGDATRAREIARLDIANISNLAPLSDYAIRAKDIGGWSGKPAFEASGLTVSHQRRDSIWSLLAVAAARVASAWAATADESDTRIQAGHGGAEHLSSHSEHRAKRRGRRVRHGEQR